MQNLELNHPPYQEQVKDFKKWLLVLNYSQGTIYGNCNSAREFFHYLEQQKIWNLQHVHQYLINSYFDYLLHRNNQNKGGGSLRYTTVQKHKAALKMLKQYLSQYKNIHLNIVFPFVESQNNTPLPLSIEEIGKLYKACTQDILGKRDSAMLALYYGCGLRRSEGTNLNVGDIDLIRGQLLVKKSKTHHQRYVPLSKQTQKHIEKYLYESREHFLDSSNNEPAFLVSSRGKRLSKESATYRLNKLVEQSNYPAFNQKQVSTHVLRHSIGTHLLQKGMQLEDIALFLGHRSLDSTQIYTHLAKS